MKNISLLSVFSLFLLGGISQASITVLGSVPVQTNHPSVVSSNTRSRVVANFTLVDTASTVETIVLFRHGEKPDGGLGQLTPQGLNRALALPNILIGKYGKPNFLFAPDTAVKVDGGQYSYCRPLATIEPTAIFLGMPVNAQIGYSDTAQLQSELTKPIYASSTVFVAWEHNCLCDFARSMIKTYGGDVTQVPDWWDSDYDSIFVIRLTSDGSSITDTFTIDHEGLNGKLSSVMPSPAPVPGN